MRGRPRGGSHLQRACSSAGNASAAEPQLYIPRPSRGHQLLLRCPDGCFEMCSLKVCVFLLVLAAATAQDAKPTYPTRYDNIDLEEILRSERLLKNYFNCLMESGPCTPDGIELRKILPDALKNKCSACTPKQQAGTERVIRFLIENHPKEFLRLEKKYDPSGLYRQEYQAEAEKRGIRLPEPL